MRIALISDVHANLAALEAVLEQIEGESIAQVVCLGDLVGYHAEPAECLHLIREHADVVVAGNHDRDIAREATLGTGSSARMVQHWTASVLSQEDRDYLKNLPSHSVQERFVAAHGAYLSEVFVSGYVTSTMLEENLMAIAARPSWPRLAFCGHTHVPMLGAWDGAMTEESGLREASDYPRRAKAVLINPGSVGQPRDGDARAAFAIVDLEARRVELRRVPYDIARTEAALKNAGFSAELGERLREGR